MPIPVKELEVMKHMSMESVIEFLEKQPDLAFHGYEIAIAFNRDRSTASSLLNKMAKNGIIKRKKIGKCVYFYHNGIISSESCLVSAKQAETNSNSIVKLVNDTGLITSKNQQLNK